MSGPLSGVRVVEFAGIGPGPFCGMLLADLGADVISVERRPPPGEGARLVDSGLLRRGRRSIVVDLKHAGGVDAVLALVKTADALFEGYRPGVAERLGVGPGVCLEANARLVYARMTGWGQDGPLAPRAGHDLTYLALTGALHAIGREDPTPPLNLVADFGGGGMLLALGLLAGILEARTTGRGQVVDAAMVDGVNVLMTMFWGLYARGEWHNERGRNVLDGGAPFNDVFRCSDGRHVAVAAIEPQFRTRLLERLGIPYEEADLGLDEAIWPGLRQRLAATFAQRPRDAWAELLADEDACVAPVLDLDEAPSHPHAVARRSFGPAGTGVQPAPAPRFSRTAAPMPGPPPAFGADTDVVLADAGLTPAEVAALRASGAVG